MKIHDPVGRAGDSRFAMAGEPSQGTAIGILGNGKPNAEPILDRIRQRVAPALGLNIGQSFDKTVHGKGSGEGAPVWVIDALAGSASAVLAGSGDCGGCSSWSIRDAVELEKRGVATVTVCTDVFEPLARNLAAGLGMPNLAIAVLAHPLATRSPEEMDAIADELAPEVIAALQRRAPARDAMSSAAGGGR